LILVLDRARRHCLWKRKDKDKVNSLAAWDMVCKPKNKGGLGIINLQIQNNALLLKQLDKFYNNEDIHWVHLARDAYYHHDVPHAVVLFGSPWWKNIISLADDYRAISSVNVGNGSTALFWSDSWKNQLLDSSFPRLFSFVRDKLQSVKEFLEKDSVMDNFHLPLSIEAHQEFQQMMEFISDVAQILKLMTNGLSS
jgi:hypothetical protein